MADATSLEELAHSSYWDKRYQNSDKDSTFEWFKSFQNLQPFFSTHLPPPTNHGKCPRILHLGCGNSALPIDLHSKGYQNQVCVDFSTVVINDMTNRFSDRSGIDWKVADVRCMTHVEAGDFDVAIDKGTLDAMISGSLWDPPAHVRDNIKKYIDAVVRVLKTGGVFLYITYRQPHFMKPLLLRDGIWDLRVVELKEEAGTFEYFAFVLTKK
ncbi:S-adenosyl-L-methionine-dependent methyltransferase [Westerdykella ornata]|uniref:S-adenosyl-L-methionine-dependent methyltransferase n=1 Tax=Westerdykella ornata TaxID=318751 RepID=A0A6A6J7G8_WESOR|nr:S-adenosyl-L-methionine-dependent methyltransferase [Westerdykella ornata]KAF2272335.1 S-adenosyl-L-methionine-dependent methyltransferase [Westerdykella ornata]